jgi:hypothetical protein
MSEDEEDLVDLEEEDLELEEVVYVNDKKEETNRKLKSKRMLEEYFENKRLAKELDYWGVSD